MSGKFDGALHLKDGDYIVYGSAESVMAVSAIITHRDELLEALEEICLMQARNYGDATQTHMDFPELAAKARAAIAKARGEKA